VRGQSLDLIVTTHAMLTAWMILAKAVAWFDRDSGRAAGPVGRIARASVETKSGPS
jgi:hypothetical protein